MFLGVTYDRMLTFKAQVEKVSRSFAKGARLLGALSGKEWGWNGGLLRRVFRAIPLSIASYCGAGWQPWLAKSTVAMLDRAQNRCLRAVSGLRSLAPVESVRLEAGIPSFETLIRRNAAIALEKSYQLGESNPRREIALVGVRIVQSDAAVGVSLAWRTSRGLGFTLFLTFLYLLSLLPRGSGTIRVGLCPSIF